MKPSLLLAGVLFLSFVPADQDPLGARPFAPAPAAGPGARAPQDGKAAKVSEADVKKLAEALSAVLESKDDYKKHDTARKNFAAEVERIDKALKPATVLGMPEVWNDVYYAKREGGISKSPSGLGRVEEKKLSATISGKPAEFRYGLLLPNQFDIKKRYPLIIALHDKPANRDRDVNGPLYLNEVWMKAPKEVRDQFIIIAPTMGSGALGKDFRVEWGDVNHIRMIALPLQEMLAKYPVDFDRVFMEGTGEGGQFAMHLALMSPHAWAGVAVRSTIPKFPQLVQNGGTLPIQMHFRAGSPQATSPVRGIVEQNAKTLGLPLEVKEDPAADKPVKGPFESDVILEATAPIAQFFTDKKREVAPKKLTFITRNADRCYWVKLTKFENDDNFGTKLSGDVEVPSNTINLTTTGIEDLKVYLCDRLVNMELPVKITVNGQSHTERQFARSVDVLLKYFEANPNDPGIQPTAVVESIKVAPESKPESSPSTPPK